MLITASVEVIDEAGEWMGKHGVSGVYFDPADEPCEYNNFMFVTLHNETSAIRLYK